MKFAPQTEKQIAEANLIPSGVHPFEVIGSEAKQSKAGNDMIELQLRVFLPDGSSRQLRDWLLEKLAYKLFHFCSYCGLATQYQEGTLTSQDCIGKSGYVKITIKPDANGVDRNNVADYVRAPATAGSGMKTSGVVSRAASSIDAGTSEDVPF